MLSIDYLSHTDKGKDHEGLHHLHKSVSESTSLTDLRDNFPKNP